MGTDLIYFFIVFLRLFVNFGRKKIKHCHFKYMYRLTIIMQSKSWLSVKHYLTYYTQYTIVDVRVFHLITSNDALGFSKWSLEIEGESRLKWGNKVLVIAMSTIYIHFNFLYLRKMRNMIAVILFDDITYWHRRKLTFN